MKSFLLFSVSVVLYGSLALAQESLFPELNIGEDEQNILPVSEEMTPEEEAELYNQPYRNEMREENLPATQNETTTSEDNEESNEENIFIALNNIRSNIAQVRAVSSCQANFVLFNGFKKRKLETFEITLTIGETEKTFKFNNVAPQKPAGEHIILVGKDCESILSQPKTKLTQCKIQGLSPKQCAQKVIYITLPETTNTQN